MVKDSLLLILIHFFLHVPHSIFRHSERRRIRINQLLHLLHDIHGKPSSSLSSSINEMARRFDTIANINREKDVWIVVVRITDVWTVVNNKQESHLEMVIMDAKGDKIQVLVPKEETNKWTNRVREEMICKLQNFNVAPNDFKYKACDHGFKLIFTPTTLLREVDSSEIPNEELNFKDFGDILNGKYRADLLVDVIGAVHQIVFSKTNCANNMVSLRLMDLSGNILACTLWQEYSTRFLSAYHGRETTGPFVLLIKYARIRPTDGTYPVAVSNSYNYSKIFLNEQIPPIVQFKERLKPEEVLQLSIQTQTQLTGGAQFTDLDRFKYKAPPTSLTNIKQLYQNTTCTTVMTTGRIVVNQFGWSYHGCGHCRKGLKPSAELFVCQDGHQNKAPVPRYKVLVRGKDNNGAEYNFLFWDQDSEQMIESSALDLINKMKEEGEDDPMAYPADLDHIIGRTMAVRVKVEPRNRQASVVRYSESKDWIEKLMEEMETAENTSQDGNNLAICSENLNMETNSSKTDKAKSVMSEDFRLDSQSLSATADHDPDNIVALTPAKRNIEDSCSIDLISPQNLSAKFSSTAKPLQIKTEEP